MAPETKSRSKFYRKIVENDIVLTKHCSISPRQINVFHWFWLSAWCLL